MHELSLAESMIEQIEDTLRDQAGTQAVVTQITLEIGAMSGVDQEAFAFVFPVASEGSRCENATLVFKEIPLTFKCNACGKVTETETSHVICSSCNGVDVEILGGRYFRILSMEVEDV